MGCCCAAKNVVVPRTSDNTYKSEKSFVSSRHDSIRVKSPPMSRENSAMQRFNQVGFSKTDPLKLINGYLNEPLVSLEEALEPFDGKIDHLSHYIQEAKIKCHYPSEHKLTRDESAAIYIYTMRWGHGNLYDHLQRAWSSDDPSQLRPWFRYLRLFKSAFDKLPIAKTEIWQGIPYREDLNAQLTSKSAPLYSCMGSGSPSMNEIKEYLKKNPGAKIILVGYDSVDGKDVTIYKAGSSKEIMMFPGMKLGVAQYEVIDEFGSVIVHFKKRIVQPEPTKVIIPIPDKHFVCPTKTCGNRCRGGHLPKHCYGFTNVFHAWEHKCGPTHKCFRCEKEVNNISECSKCHSYYCEACCFK